VIHTGFFSEISVLENNITHKIIVSRLKSVIFNYLNLFTIFAKVLMKR